MDKAEDWGMGSGLVIRHSEWEIISQRTFVPDFKPIFERRFLGMETGPLFVTTLSMQLLEQFKRFEDYLPSLRLAFSRMSFSSALRLCMPCLEILSRIGSTSLVMKWTGELSVAGSLG